MAQRFDCVVPSSLGCLGRLVLLAMLALWAPSAWAESAAPIEVRAGNHPGFGRLVFEFAAHTPYHQERTGNDLSLHFAGDVTVTPPAHPPRNVDAVTARPGEIDLAVQTGATTHVFWIGNRLVVDVLDLAENATGQAPQAAPPAPAQATTPTASSRAVATHAGAVPAGMIPAGTNPAPTTQATVPPGATQAAITQPAVSRTPVLPPAATLAAPSGNPVIVSPIQEPPTPGMPTRRPPRGAAASLPLPPPPAPPIPPAPQILPAAPSTTASPHASQTVVPAVQGSAASPAPSTAVSPVQAVPTAPSPAQAVPAGMPPSSHAGQTANVPSQATTPIQAAIPASIQVPIQVAMQAPIRAPIEAVVQATAHPAAQPPTQPAVQPPALPPTLAAATADLTAALLAATAGTPVGPVEPLAGAADPPQPIGMVLTLPFPTSVGVAAFRRGDSALVVFDERTAIDLAAVRADPVLGTATVELLPEATVLHLKLPTDRLLAISRERQGWRLGVVATAPPARPIPMRSVDGALTLSADAVGEVVAIDDPETGATLLVGTQRAAGQGFPTLRQTPEFSLLPTWQGVVVEPLADNLVMRAGSDAFLITGGSKGLTLAPTSTATQAQADAAGMTRRFDLHAQPLPALVERLHREVLAAAAAPPLARGPLREAAAETMIALGMGAEAQGMLHLAAADDPALATSADMAGLGAVAALLAHRITEADGIEDPRLSGSDEVMLWRAVRTAARTPGSPLAAAGFATTAPLIAVYPAALRQRLLPLAAETMIKGGQKAAATRLLARQPDDDPTLALARGMLRQADGDTDGALAIYDRLANDPDRLVHDRAALHAVQLRLLAGRIDAAHAADALDLLLYAWRGGHRELALREWIAALREYSGNWTAALAMLHETEALFPDASQAVHARLRAAFMRLLQDKALDRLAPLELVSMVEENADLLPTGPAGEALEERLADRLLALDLPNRAAPVLAKLMAAAPSPAGRAGFGARLAALRLREDDAKGALAALAASADPTVSEPPAASATAPAMGSATASATAPTAASGSAPPAASGAAPETTPAVAASAAAAAPEAAAASASAGPPPLPPPLPAPLIERRTLLMAAAQARLGDTAHAVAELAALGTAAADLARAAILEQAKDWPNAEHALADYVGKAVPSTGALDAAQQQVLVRYATAAAQAGDEATLTRLRTDDGPRMPAGAFGDMFRLLTAAPVQVSADLPRAIRETALAHELPKSLDALNPPTGSP